MTASAESAEYEVEKIIGHITYQNAFARRFEIDFNPDDKDARYHSQYVYHVKWLGWEQTTWEPEYNLEDNIELFAYKERKKLPLDHQRFTGCFRFDSKDSRPTSAAGFIHSPSLLKASASTSSTLTAKETPRPRTSPLTHSASTSREAATPARKKDKKKHRRKDERRKSKSTKDDVLVCEKENFPETQKFEAKKDSTDHKRKRQIPVIRYVMEDFGDRGRSMVKQLHMTRRYNSAERLSDRWQWAVEEEKEQRERDLWAATMFRLIQQTMRSTPSKRNVTCVQLFMQKAQDKEDNDEVWRVKGSSKLKKFLRSVNIPLKVPVFDSKSAVHFSQTATSELSADPDLPTVSDAISTTSARSPLISLSEDVVPTELMSFSVSESTVKSATEDTTLLIGRLRSCGAGLTLDEESLVKKLAQAYAESRDRVVYALAMQFADDKTRFRVIQELLKSVRIGQMPADLVGPPSSDIHRLAKLLVSSDLRTSSEEDTSKLGKAYNCCGKEGTHWKCSMLWRLLSAMPPQWRFHLDSSPFNTDVFMHCMLHGAHCQKIIFLLLGVPFGLATVPLNGCEADAMLVAVHQGNPRYVVDFIRMGMDVNTFGWKEITLGETEQHALGVKTKTIPVSMSMVFDRMESSSPSKFQSTTISAIRSMVAGLADRLSKFCHRRLTAQLASVSFASVKGSLTPAHIFRSLPFDTANCLSTLSWDDVIYNPGKWTAENCLRVSQLDPEYIEAKDVLVVLSVFAVKIIGGREFKNEYRGKRIPPLTVVPDAQPECSVMGAELVFNDSDTVIELEQCFESEVNSGQWFFQLPLQKARCLEERMMFISLKTDGPPNKLFAGQLQVVSNSLF